MRSARTIRAAAVLAAAPLAVTGLAVAPASAHGTLGDPVSRIAACYEEGPESPQSEMCVRLVEENGTQPLYDWHEVNLPDADGEHRDVIPDGELCSAGRDKYSALDNPGDWTATELPSGGGEYTFEYTAAVPHEGYIEYYVTTDDWDPSTPLAWDDLESEPFVVHDRPEAEGGVYEITADLPDKSGEHLIYTVWQRTDSPEAFYSCSDVVFGGDSGATTTAAEGDGFDVDLTAYEDADHGEHAEHGAEENAGNGSEDAAEADEAAAPAEDDGAEADGSAREDHGAHGGHDEQAGATLPETGSAITGLFAAAIALMAAGAGALHLARRSKAAEQA